LFSATNKVKPLDPKYTPVTWRIQFSR